MFEITRPHNRGCPHIRKESFKNGCSRPIGSLVSSNNNTVRIYKNEDFTLVDPVLTYYKRPTYIQIDGCTNVYTGVTSTQEVECEFKDDIVELILDEAASILAGDIENFSQYTREQQAAERNN